MVLTGCVGAVPRPVYDPAYSTNPDFIGSRPGSADVDSFARSAGLSPARATVRLECVITDRGAVNDCRILLQDSDDGRTGAAAVALLKTLRIKPATYSGVPTDGARVRWTVRFNQRGANPIEMEVITAPGDGRFAYAGLVRDGRAALYVRGPEPVQADGSVEIWVYEFPMRMAYPNLTNYRASFRRYDCARGLRDDPTVEVHTSVNAVKTRLRGSGRLIHVPTVGAEAAAFKIACKRGPEAFTLSGLKAVRDDVQRRSR